MGKIRGAALAWVGFSSGGGKPGRKCWKVRVYREREGPTGGPESDDGKKGRAGKKRGRKSLAKEGGNISKSRRNGKSLSSLVM